MLTAFTQDELQKELRGARKQLKDLNEAKADLEQRCEAVVLEKRDAERQASDEQRRCDSVQVFNAHHRLMCGSLRPACP